MRKSAGLGMIIAGFTIVIGGLGEIIIKSMNHTAGEEIVWSVFVEGVPLGVIAIVLGWLVAYSKEIWGAMKER